MHTEYIEAAARSRGLGFGAGVVLCVGEFTLQGQAQTPQVTTTGLVNLSFQTRLVSKMVWVWAPLCLKTLP